jgi:hypothetical protein
VAVSDHHPLYTDREAEWKLMRDSYRETTIKAASTDYLPMPGGFVVQPDAGAAMYAAYMLRAEFPEITLPTLAGTVGVIHRVEAQIDLPDALLPLTETATKDGQPLEAFHQRITTEILSQGRFGVLVDAANLEDPIEKAMSEARGGLPWLSGYTAESIINWAPDRSTYILDESGQRFDPESFAHKEYKQFRVLRWDGTTYTQQVYTPDPGPLFTPEAGGRGTKFTEIPFSVVGPRDMNLLPDDPPLLGVARAALSLYQLSADWRHQMFHSGQETLFLFGWSDKQVPAAIGAGVIATAGKDARAEYVGPAGTGIEAHRQAIIDKRLHAVQAGARLFDAGDKHAAESGDALSIRYAAQTATLTTVSVASARCLERSLRFAALMVGANPEEVVVRPNLKFIDTVLAPDQALNLVKSWQAGAMSKLSLFENLQRGEIVSPERTFEEEESLIQAEGPALGPVGREPAGAKSAEPPAGQKPPAKKPSA